MPWPPGIPAWLKNQWGLISGQVSQRATTAQIINSLRPYAAASPVGWGPRGVISVQQLRSAAVAIRSAADRITRDGMSGTITAAHIAEAPWSRSALQQSLAPRYMVRAFVESANPGAIAGVPGVPATIEQWVTFYTDRLPGTLEELTENITSKAGESGSPPAPISGISRIEILRE